MPTPQELLARNIGNALTNIKTWGGVMYNVLDEGLVGGGLVDDTVALQQLIDKAIAAGRRTIYFPHGENGQYYVTSLTNADQVDFVGDNCVFVGGYSGTISNFGGNAELQAEIAALQAETVTGIFNVLTGYGGDIQGAIDEAATVKGTVYVPSNNGNEYTIANTISVPSDVCLIIDPAVTLKLANGANCPIIQNADIANGNSNIRIIGGIFDANKSNQTVDFATIQMTKVTDSWFENIEVNGNRQTGYTQGAFDFYLSDNNVIINCKVHDAEQEGLWLRRCARNRVTGGEYYNNVASGVAHTVGDYNVFENIYAHDNGATNITVNGKYTRVHSCTCENSITNGITVGHSTTYEGLSQAGDFSIVTSNICKNNGSAGINIAFSLGVLCEANTIDNCGGTGLVAGIDVVDGSTRCVINGNIVNSSYFGIRLQSSAGENAYYCIVTNNYCKNNSTQGIIVFNAKHCIINGNTSENNGQSGSGHGIWLSGVATQFNIVNGNRCLDTQGTKTQQRGIYVDGNKNNIIGNMLIGNKDFPYVASPGNTIRDNTLSDTDNTTAVVTISTGTSTTYSNANIRSDSIINFNPTSETARTRNIVLTTVADGSVTFSHVAGGASDAIRVYIG